MGIYMCFSLYLVLSYISCSGWWWMVTYTEDLGIEFCIFWPQRRSISYPFIAPYHPHQWAPQLSVPLRYRKVVKYTSPVLLVPQNVADRHRICMSMWCLLVDKYQQQAPCWIAEANFKNPYSLVNFGHEPTHWLTICRWFTDHIDSGGPVLQDALLATLGTWYYY